MLSRKQERLALLYEPFFGDETDCVTLANRFVNGRYPHRCHWCWGTIVKGERHRALTERNNEDRVVATTRFCAACCDAMAKSFADCDASLQARFLIFDKRGRAA